MAGPDLRHRMQQAVRGNARRNRSSRPPQEKTALHPPVPRQSTFPNTLAWAIPARLFRVCADALDRDGAGARPLSSTPLTVGVARHRGRRAGRGRPYPRDLLAARRCEPLAAAHPCESLRGTAGAQSGGGRKRAPSSHPAGSCRSSPAQPQSCGNCQPCIEPCWASGKSRSGSFACGRRKLRRGATRIEQGAPRRLLGPNGPRQDRR